MVVCLLPVSSPLLLDGLTCGPQGPLMGLKVTQLREGTPGFYGMGQGGNVEIWGVRKRPVGCSRTLEISEFLSTEWGNGGSKRANTRLRPLRVWW